MSFKFTCFCQTISYALFLFDCKNKWCTTANVSTRVQNAERSGILKWGAFRHLLTVKLDLLVLESDAKG